MPLTVVEHPLGQDLLSRLREEGTDPAEFRTLTRRLGWLLVLEATGFDALVRSADLVITGEGRTDFQTAMGKAPVGVAAAAKRHGVPVICLSGGLGDGAEEVLSRGIDALESVVPGPMVLEDCMARDAELVEAAAARVCRAVAVGRGMRQRSP